MRVRSNGYPPGQDRNDWPWLLWNNRRFLWHWTLRGLIAATLIAFLIPKRYEAVTRLMPPDSSSGGPLSMLAALGGKSSTLGMLASNFLSQKNSDGLFVGVLKSDTVQDSLINRFDLRKVYWDRYMYDARKDLTRYTDISQDRKSEIITIKVVDRDPHRATAMAQAYVDELNHVLSQVSTSAAHRERIFIEGRLKTVKQNLENAATQFSEYASKNTALDVPTQTKAMVQASANLQGQIIAAQSELEGLEQIYTDNNVRVRSLRARIDELKRQAEKMNGNSSPPSPDGPSSDELYPPIRQLPLLGVRWADLYRETKIQETVYEMLTQQYEMAKIQEAKETPTAKVLDPPLVPEKKASPHRLLIMIFGTFLSFSLAAAWILGRTSWREIDPENPRKQLAEEIGNSIHSRWQVWQAKLHRGNGSNGHGMNGNGSNGSSRTDSEN